MKNPKWYSVVIDFLKEMILSSGEKINSPMQLAFFGGVILILLGLIVQPLARTVFGAGNAISDGQFNLVITGGGLLFGLGLIGGTFLEWSKNKPSSNNPEAQSENATLPKLEKSKSNMRSQPKLENTANESTSRESQMKLKELISKSERKFLAECLSESDLVVSETSRRTLFRDIDFVIRDYVKHIDNLVFSKALINDLVDNDRQESFITLLDEELATNCEKNHPEYVPEIKKISEKVKNLREV